MRTRWLAGPSDASEVIVAFGGWAAGAGPLAHLSGDCDVLFCDDWRDLGAELPSLEGYARRSLVAWSFGVAAYAHWQAGQATGFDRRVALCGSPVPVDRRLGIPPAIFARTRDRLDRDTLKLFLDRAGVPPVADADIDALRDELDVVEARGVAPEVVWNNALITSRDHVFPEANLRRAFEGVPLRVVEAPHCPFGLWQSWNEVLG